MAPVIETSEEVVKYLKKSGRPFNQEPPYGFKKGFTYLHSIKLYVEEESHEEENWNKAHDLLSKRNLRMPEIPEFIIFLDYVEKYNEKIYDDIIRVRNPWRVEGIDACFIERNDGFHVLTRNRTNAEKLKPALMEDRHKPGISLEDWVKGKNITVQGLPNLNASDGSLHHVYPRNNRVAGLEKRPDGSVILDFELDPYTTSTAPILMVRGCFSPKSKKDFDSVMN